MLNTQQQKDLLAVLLPSKLGTFLNIEDCRQTQTPIPWRHKHASGNLLASVLDTEIPYLREQVEASLSPEQLQDYARRLFYRFGAIGTVKAPTSQRLEVLAELLKVEIPA